LLLLGGCSVDGGARIDEVAWKSELLEHRDDKDEEFRSSSTSPMAGTQYLKSEPTDRLWLTREGKAFGLAYTETPGASLFLANSDGEWNWTAGDEGVTCRVDDEEVEEGTVLAGPAAFLVGGSRLSFYPSEERVTFIVFDADRPEKIAFDHLLYFPPDRTYAVDARLVRFEEPEEVEMLTSRDLIKTFYRYARIQFRLGGNERELTAFKSTLTGEDSTGLFVPFRDATSGHETYGAGRFLEIAEPDGDEFVLDFNRCFNPLCNYSPAYNCTVPPRENHLDIAIRAGEKAYPH
jgi:uncharacterized protein (DUF1684 family)